MTEFTKAQDLAISSKEKNLLVSASAGTGKTTVMIERIVQLIVKEVVTIDDILVVTFTNASAQDMKQKLLRSLESRATNPKIREQVENIDSASISTLHSFCIEVLRKYFYVVDVDPAFIIVDTKLSEGYADRVLTDVLNEYSQQKDAQFEEVYRIYCANRNENVLKEQIFALHDFATCLPYFEQWYSQTRDINYDFSQDNLFCNIINDEYTTNSNAYAKRFEQYSYVAKKYGADALAQYCTEMSLYYTVARANTLEVNFANLNAKDNPVSFLASTKKHKSTFTVDEYTFERFVKTIDALREEAKKNIKDKYSDLFKQPYAQLVKHSTDMVAIMDKLVEIERKFCEKYLEYKKAHAMLDFGDLEHLTLAALQDSEVLSQLQSKYKYIFVDEYQDINGVQEKIISTLASNSNLFLVGDIKQGIYGFRQCDADIFAEKYEQYPHRDDCKVIELTDNFRTDNRILQQVNEIFNLCMSNSFGKVDYKKNCNISSHKQFDDEKQPFQIIELPVVKKTVTQPTSVYDISSVIDYDLPDKGMIEANAVINQIRQLVGKEREFEQEGTIVKRPTRYDDIAILVRNAKEDTITLFEQLEFNNIPVCISLEDKYSTKECADVVNFLKVVDNPLNDVALVGVMLSFFGKLSKFEVAQIVIATKQPSVYERCCQYMSEHNDNITSKLSNILSLITDYQVLDHTCAVDELLNKLIERTKYNLYVITLPNGIVRVNRLFSMIADAQGQAFSQSVCKYLQYIQLSNNKSTDKQAALSGGVKITTIHKSKGLEFPIVIGVGLSKNFVYDNRRLITSIKCGFAMPYFDREKRTVVKTISSFAINLSNRMRIKEEELRLLYVLTTRAKNKLILITSDKRSQPISKPPVAEHLCDWITYTARVCDIKTYDSVECTTKRVKAEIPPQNTDSRQLMQRINFTYPYMDRVIPTKVVASGLKQWVQQFNDNDSTQDNEATPTIVVDEQQIKEQAAVISNYASIGTAYHRLCENTFFGATAVDVHNSLKRLVANGVIEQSIADVLNVDYVARVFNLSKLQQLCKGKVYHEVPFMEKLPFDKLVKGAPRGDTVLQGVIDLLAISDEGAVILDFKYTSNSANIVSNYQLQMNAYTLATKKILNSDNVHAYIVSIKDGKVIKLT